MRRKCNLKKHPQRKRVWPVAQPAPLSDVLAEIKRLRALTQSGIYGPNIHPATVGAEEQATALYGGGVSNASVDAEESRPPTLCEVIAESPDVAKTPKGNWLKL